MSNLKKLSLSIRGVLLYQKIYFKINNDNEKFSISNYYHLKDTVWDYEKVKTKVFLRKLKTQGLPISNKDWNFEKE